ncbi:MAG: hypothetical protein ACI89L_000901 [Phycisphaerales bacterium]|jgi:hypothetical protein
MARTPKSLRRATLAIAVALPMALPLSLGGCHSPSGKAQVNPGPTAWGQQPRAYPFALEPVAVEDVQVFREVTRLKMTNTTATSFGTGTVWINRRYARDIEGFGAGQTLDLDLNEFVDEFAAPFKAGGFFATKRPDPVVLVELETGVAQAGGSQAHEVRGFIVVRDEAN